VPFLVTNLSEPTVSLFDLLPMLLGERLVGDKTHNEGGISYIFTLFGIEGHTVLLGTILWLNYSRNLIYNYVMQITTHIVVSLVVKFLLG
jgi:hypothetical protein